LRGQNDYLVGQSYQKCVRGGLLYGPLELMKTLLWAGVDSEHALHYNMSFFKAGMFPTRMVHFSSNQLYFEPIKQVRNQPWLTLVYSL
jgi:hypothetical protein